MKLLSQKEIKEILERRLSKFICKDEEILEDIPSLATSEGVISWCVEEALTLVSDASMFAEETEREFDLEKAIEDAIDFLVRSYELEEVETSSKENSKEVIETDSLEKNELLLYLNRVIEEYKDKLEGYYERLDVYPEATYSRPYLYIYKDVGGNIDCKAVDEMCTNQLYADEILNELEFVPTLDELRKMYTYFCRCA